MSTLTPSEVASLDRKGPEALREAGCNCEFGCRSCDSPLARVGNCPAFDPCPLGRAKAVCCPVHGTE